MKALTKIKGLDQVSVVIFNCARGLTNCKCVNFLYNYFMAACPSLGFYAIETLFVDNYTLAKQIVGRNYFSHKKSLKRMIGSGFYLCLQRKN